jgi:hypothetical protein
MTDPMSTTALMRQTCALILSGAAKSIGTETLGSELLIVKGRPADGIAIELVLPHYLEEK